MEKFAIILTKDNNQKVISAHATKEEALKAGEIYNGVLKKNAGVLSCVLVDMDENDNLLDGKSKIFRTWL